MSAESREYPERIYAGHLGGSRRVWKPEVMDEVERAHVCAYVRADLASAAPEMLEALTAIRHELRARVEHTKEHGMQPEPAKYLHQRIAAKIDAAIAKAEGRS